jgi:hypothetical protein
VTNFSEHNKATAREGSLRMEPFWELRRSLYKKLSWLFALSGLLLGRQTEAKPASFPERIAAVQKTLNALPSAIREPLILRAQWGNWNNWVNWNNWNNWANWANWNNWGNFSNF